MFFVVPVGNGQRSRILPRATLGLALAMIALGAWTLPQAANRYGERSRAEAGLRSYTESADANGKARDTRLERVRRAALGARIAALEAADPCRTYGYETGAAPWRALAALFLHADALHLLGNLVGLLALGWFVEPVVGGRGVLLAFLGGGALAMAGDAALGPAGTLIGASSGVTALAGVYWARLRSLPIRCRWVYFVYLRPHFGEFHIPCDALLVLWLAQQAVGLVLAGRDAAPGVAHLAHLLGFALGAAGAAFATLLARAKSGSAALPE